MRKKNWPNNWPKWYNNERSTRKLWEPDNLFCRMYAKAYDPTQVYSKKLVEYFPISEPKCEHCSCVSQHRCCYCGG